MAPSLNKVFKPSRFAQLLLRDLTGGYRSMLVAMAAVAGTVILISGLTVLGMQLSGRHAGASNFHFNLYNNLLFLGGFIVSSLAFREIRQNGGGIFYLTLPASALEKYASKLISTSVGYALGSAVFYTAVAAASEGINRLIFGFGNAFFNPFDTGVLQALGYYLVAQSVFLLGSVWWRKLAFLKTVLTIQAVAVGVAVVAGITARIVFREYFHGCLLDIGDVPGWAGLMSQTVAGYGPLVEIDRVLKIVFLAGTAPVCWLIGWLRLRDIEV
ncbi:MAG: hypothetical protein NTU62_02370 [Spirochaetes bacterium]|nr:hypothetical protein [Spirochaetota bacterium]